MEQIRHIQDAEKCTFKPEINTESASSKQAVNSVRSNNSNRHERLYEDSFRTGNSKIKASIEHAIEIKKECTFTPSREATKAKDASLRRETSTQRADRLSSEWVNRSQKLEALRKMRDDLTQQKTSQA